MDAPIQTLIEELVIMAESIRQEDGRREPVGPSGLTTQFTMAASRLMRSAANALRELATAADDAKGKTA